MTDAEDNVFDRALDAAKDAFKEVIDDHFRRTFDGSPEDEAALMQEYRASSESLRGGSVMRLRTGLVDADFACWHSDLADSNFGDVTA